MANKFDPSTLETGSSRLKLADELIFTPQAHGEKTYYHIEHSSKGKFYRVGYAEYVFLSLLDGKRTVAQALTITARMLGSEGLTQSRGIQVAAWLVENGLATTADLPSGWSADPNGSAEWLGRINPFWMKCRFGSPDRLLTALMPTLGWLFSPLGTLAGLGVILMGVGCVISDWTPFFSSASAVLTPHNWLWMLLAWFCLKLIHESSHALACKYYRGNVRDTGVIFILLAPMAFVDVTSCWRFPSRWQRIHVAAAGMFAELVTAAFAAIVWTQTDSPVTHHLLFNVIVMASLSTLLFNANPLMRFDGYYILSDLLQIPNLAGEGNRFLKSTASSLFFGSPMRPLQSLGFQRWFVPVYGFLAAAWKITICLSLVTASSVLFHGAGLLLALLGVCTWFGIPFWKLAVELRRRWDENRPSFIRATSVATVVSVALAALLLYVPWPGAMTAPVIVDYADSSIVRSGAPGFIRQVHVVDGQVVKEGQLLLELSNDELAAQRLETELDYRQNEVEHRVALNDRDGSQAQIVHRNLEGIQERLAETRRRSEALKIRAPIAGRVVARNLTQRLGTYVNEGEELLTVANEGQKELVMSVGQKEFDAIVERVGEPTQFRIGSRLTRVGHFKRLDPRASTTLPHPAMSSAVGGPLAVKQDESGRDSSTRLVEPGFEGVVTLPPEVCLDLGAGERGYAILGLRRESIGQFAWGRLTQWWESLLRPEQF